MGIVVLLGWLPAITAYAEIFTCKVNGKVIYTDDKSQCSVDTSRVELDIPRDKRVNFRYPERQYLNKSDVYSIYIEAPETDKDREQLGKAVERLNKALDLIFKQIPPTSHAYLKKTNFYIMLGPRARLGGEKSGLRYFGRNGDQRLLLGDKRWSHAVVIYSVENFLWLSDLWVNKSVIHELAHAWHYEDWSKNYRILKDAWMASRNQSLYLAQEDVKGQVLKPAYASKNEKEYFSELSAMYFVGGNYYPYNKANLKKYDPVGYTMVERVWGL